MRRFLVYWLTMVVYLVASLALAWVTFALGEAIEARTASPVFGAAIPLLLLSLVVAGIHYWISITPSGTRFIHWLSGRLFPSPWKEPRA